MKEGKIKNFIKLIHKIHKGKQDLPDIVVDTFTDQETGENSEKRRPLTMSIDEMSEKKEAARDEGSNAASLSQTRQVGIFFTQESIRPRSEDKKSLYQLYRESLERKKDSFHQLLVAQNRTLGKSRSPQEMLSSSVNSPLSRKNVLKPRGESFTYQRLLKKKSTFRGNCSIPILSSASEKRLEMNPGKVPKSPPHTQGRSENSSAMRKRKLNYKPMFRVKRLALENYRTEPGDSYETPKFQKYSGDNRNKSLKTEPLDDRKASFREKVKQKRQSRIVANFSDKFSAWDYEQPEKSEQGELLAKCL